MDSRTRLETAWSFREPDRVPIELRLSPQACDLPEAARLVAFEADEADNFLGAPGFDWGFFGLDSKSHEETVKEDAEYRWVRRTQVTPAGEFYAITRHRHDELNPNDYHWERRFIHTLEELERLAGARREVRAFNKAGYEKARAAHGDRGIVLTGLLHPLGRLVRQANMEEVYIWMLSEKRIFHAYLESTNNQVAESVRTLKDLGVRADFSSTALEMLIPPWMGREAFEELIFPYDKQVHDAVHAIGGRVRSHCHGNCGEYLERFAEMGIDATEPLEPPPYGDNDLTEARRKVGGRMLLSGNIVSQDFPFATEEAVREAVRRAIRTGAPGGGFTLRCTGGTCGTNSAKDLDQLRDFIRKIEAYLDAGLAYGQYPIQ